MNTPAETPTSTPPAPALAHRIAAGVLTLVFAALWLYEGYYVVTAWFPTLYDEITPINGVAAGGFMTLMFACAIAAWVRPLRHLAAARVLVIGTTLIGVLLPLAFVVDEPLFTVVGWLVAALVVAPFVRTHPARGQLLPRAAGVSPVLGALAVAATVALTPMAVTLQRNQLRLDDEVAERWFYGGMTMYLVAILALAWAAALDRTLRRLAGLSAAGLAALLATVSLVYPDELHSLATVPAVFLLVGSVAVAASALVPSRELDGEPVRAASRP